MKKHFLITLLLLYSVSAFNQVATIGTYSSQNSGQTYRSIHDFIGLNGANTLTQTSFFSNTDVNIQLRDFRPSYLRYPGGTLANYWDWQEGWLFRGISNNGCISLLPDYQKRIRTNPVFVAGSLNDHGSDYLKDLKTSIIGTGAKPLIVMNPLTSDLNYQLAMLLYAKEINLPSPRVEIGNEFYLPRCAYQKQFNSAYQYANLVVDWESAIHDYVSADIKISAVASNADPQNSSTDRRDQWNSDLYSQFGNSVTPDAYSIHQYKSTNLDLTDVLGPTLYSKVFGNVSNDIISMNSYIQQLHNPQDIWLTEFSVLSDDRPIHGTWYHGLYNAYLTLRFLDIENISSTNMHAMSGDYIFSGFFNNSTGFNSGSSYPIYMKTACNGSIPSTVPYGKTAVGMTSSLLSQAFT